MKLAKDISILVMVLVFALVGVETARFVHDARATVKQTTAALAEVQKQTASLPGLLDNRLGSIQAQTDNRLQSIQGDVTRQVAGIRQDAKDIITGAVATADKRLEAIQSDLKTQTASLTSSAAQVAGSAAKALDEATKAEQAVNDTLPLFTDCDHNADCLYNRYVGTARGIERASDAVGKAATDLAKSAKGLTSNADRISADVAKVADSFVAPKKWWQQMRDWAITLTEVGARFL